MTETKPVVSIIVPIYNQEKYIRECIDSIIAQTFRDWELLLIDNNSTDQSVGICKCYSKSDKRIALLSEKKQGVSAARNKGLLKAKGKYIMFVDPDDYIEKDYIDKMLAEFEQNKLASCRIKLLYKNMTADRKLSRKYLGDKYNAIICRSGIDGFVWNKLYVGKIIRDKKLLFDTDCRVYEDMLFNCKYVQYIKDVKIIDEALYCYRVRKSSITHKEDDIEALKKIEDFLKENNINTLELERRIIRGYINNGRKNNDFRKRLLLYLLNIKAPILEKLRFIEMILSRKLLKNNNKKYPGELFD